MTAKPYLTGHYTPAVDEISATGLTVEGHLPPELNGGLIHNSHNPKPGVTPTHWFKGSGMVHGIRLRNGRAEWYRNRWVRTPALEDAPYMTGRGVDLTASVAGTHVIEHAGRLLALCETNFPFELDAELETVGAYDFDGKLRSAMTAHPKTDPVTGELHFFGSSPFPPYLIHYIAGAKGRSSTAPRSPARPCHSSTTSRSPAGTSSSSKAPSPSTRRVHQVGDARLPSEAVFVPAEGATGEEGGYLLTVISDLKQDSSRLLVLDASGLEQIAAVHLPRRVTGGIHGSWIPDTDL
ncbi:carotenoid oxygenase family protein [Streptosporangium pseudovulgare]|uniref:Dioxygenase n=1 Tax=Streptosporangium pseudovulgare TaxID=35765 RepID=A0ABQ2RAD5_9ACTN|nr:carotenoid oxygenase family protein [Streptosporangium pseudovulgare]GGQ18175.1 hypothetical protein GCM10010140_55720 [Streptosporangium pseudovulgare]